MIPLFKPVATDEPAPLLLSATALHIAHWASARAGTKSIKASMRMPFFTGQIYLIIRLHKKIDQHPGNGYVKPYRIGPAYNFTVPGIFLRQATVNGQHRQW